MLALLAITLLCISIFVFVKEVLLNHLERQRRINQYNQTVQESEYWLESQPKRYNRSEYYGCNISEIQNAADNLDRLFFENWWSHLSTHNEIKEKIEERKKAIKSAETALKSVKDRIKTDEDLDLTKHIFSMIKTLQEYNNVDSKEYRRQVESIQKAKDKLIAKV